MIDGRVAFVPWKTKVIAATVLTDSRVGLLGQTDGSFSRGYFCLQFPPMSTSKYVSQCKRHRLSPMFQCYLQTSSLKLTPCVLGWLNSTVDSLLVKTTYSHASLACRTLNHHHMPWHVPNAAHPSTVSIQDVDTSKSRVLVSVSPANEGQAGRSQGGR